MIKLNCPIVPDISKYTSLIEKINENGWYTNFGPMHEELTERLSLYLGVDNLLLVSNGTLALQVAYETLGVKRAITTPYSFVATASTLAWQKKDIIYADIQKETGNICFDNVQNILNEKNDYDSVVATHVFGNPCEVDKFIDLDKKVNVIYDAAHAFGVKNKGKSILSYGDASTISFHATKVFHTIEGGAIVFKTKAHFEEAKRLINFGIELDKGIQSVGINAKLNEYQAAAGLVLMDNIGEIIDKRVSLFELYRESLDDVIAMPKWLEGSTYNGAYMPIFCNSEEQLILLMEKLGACGIQTRRYFYPSLNNVIKANDTSCTSNSDDLARRSLCLPLHYYMTNKDVLTVTENIKKVLK
ncbi:DegT/DnrJ/EryC1/StrS family aminotransferase [Citrobacter portucalensis]|uniref:DegT/DnrJ/EryC1/StrS family aminotransferase n=1 Tax=Citrobacter TaxID=544 RepID=UPI00165FAF9E|nr:MULTISPECIES: DegT/DnrJ/EryC1/StrS family aminotransferase [Citrobacter]MEB7575335.1 DegT/DnrJ/EryC1/StrS family aminotransferase [Citrobacter portucalensis]